MPIGANNDLGESLLIPNLSAGSLNADFFPATDIRNYGWISLFLDTTVWSGTLAFQGAYDPNGTWISVTLYRLDNLDGAHSVSSVLSESSKLLGAPRRFPYFRCRMISYTSGTATGLAELTTTGPSGLVLTNSNPATQLVNDSNFFIGATVNDGSASVAIAAGTVSDTVISASRAMLGSILVTTTGTHQANFYDNASAGSGTIVGIVPASAAVTGVPYPAKSYCANGITLKGDTNNPAMTVFYSSLV